MEHCSHISDVHLGLCRTTALYEKYDNFDLEKLSCYTGLIKEVLSDENRLRFRVVNVIRDFICERCGRWYVISDGKGSR